jgi:hypothetical protein
MLPLGMTRPCGIITDTEGVLDGEISGVGLELKARDS